MEQVIIAIGRQNGSGGRDIANRIALDLDIKMYDVRILMEVAKEMNLDLDPGELAKYDEAPRNLFATRRVGDYTNSVEEILALKQFEYLKEKADSGESFVVLGRCADRVLKNHPGLLKVFITADRDKRIERIAYRHNVDVQEAEKIIKKTDKGRRQYYERYADGRKWGDAFWYDLILNSSRLGIDGTADVLTHYIQCFRSN